jgi:hypothetical protein
LEDELVAMEQRLGQRLEQTLDAWDARLEQKFEHHKQHMYSVTNAVEVGKEVLRAAKLKPINTMLALQRKAVSTDVLDAIKGWDDATCKDHIQVQQETVHEW